MSLSKFYLCNSCLNASFRCQYVCDGRRVDELNETMLWRGRQDSVGRQLQVEVFLLQNPIHQGDDLKTHDFNF